MNSFQKWWGDEKPASFYAYLGEPYQPAHWSARLIRSCATFCAKEWKWLVESAIAIVGLIEKGLGAENDSNGSPVHP